MLKQQHSFKTNESQKNTFEMKQMKSEMKANNNKKTQFISLM